MSTADGSQNSLIQLKVAVAQLRVGAKTLADANKAYATAAVAANKTYTAAGKVYDAAVKEAEKTLRTAAKARADAIKAADATLATAKKTGEKEAAKLTVQIDAHKAKIEQVKAALAAPATEDA